MKRQKKKDWKEGRKKERKGNIGIKRVSLCKSYGVS